MGKAVSVTRGDVTATGLRSASAKCADGARVRRILALALVLEGRPRSEAAALNGMDRQTLSDWVHVFQHRHRPNGGTAGQQRQDVALPSPTERVGDLSPQRSLGGLLGRQPRIALDAAAGALADAGLGGGNVLGMLAAEVHVTSHLLIGGGAPGQIGPPGSRGSDRARAHAATRGAGVKPAILRVADRPTLLSRGSL